MDKMNDLTQDFGLVSAKLHASVRLRDCLLAFIRHELGAFEAEYCYSRHFNGDPRHFQKSLEFL